MAQIEEIYQHATIEDNIRKKDWAAGSSIITKNKLIYIDPVQCTVKPDTEFCYSEKFNKLIDEIIVNALDHCVRTRSNKWFTVNTNNIYINFDKKNLVFTVKNDGTGICPDIHKDASRKLGRQISIIEMLFGEVAQGSNTNKSENCIIGGTNGFGAKIVNFNSLEFTVKTVYGNACKTVKWKQLNGTMTIVSDQSETLTGNIKHTKDYTEIMFILDPKLIGYENVSQIDADNWESVLMTRTGYAVLYAKLVDTNINVYYNNTLCALTFPLFVQEISKDFDICVLENNTQFKWQLAIIYTSGKRKTISVINGIHILKSSHTAAMQRKLANQIDSYIRDTLRVENNPTVIKAIKKHTSFITVCQIPGIAWNSQSKTDAKFKDSTFNGIYFSTETVVKVFERLQTLFIPDQVVKKQDLNDMYYEEASCLRERNKKTSASLIIVEGDSAASHIKNGLNAAGTISKYGIVSLGGVPLNVRKCIHKNQFGTRVNDDLMANKMFKIFCTILNLKLDANYTKNDINRLPYTQLIVCVDPDHDGMGNILGLIVSNIMHLWPSLIKIGYVWFMRPPVVQLFPLSGKKQVTRFETEDEFRTWCETNDVSKYKLVYYKGLGTYSDKDINYIAKNLLSYITKFNNQEYCESLLNVYYGDDPELRKQEYTNRVPNSLGEIANDCMVSQLLRGPVLAYKLYDLQRKLPHIYDYQTSSSRKLIWTLLNKMNSKSIKVSAVAGLVTTHAEYHHGEASMHKTIISRAFACIGGNQLPLFIAESNVGSREKGHASAGAPRYVFVKRNTDLLELLFPKEDTPYLPVDEYGLQQYYVPIIPLLTEILEIPSQGWKISAYPRDALSLISYIKLRLSGINMSYCPPYSYSDYGDNGWTGKLLDFGHRVHSIGHYTIENDHVVITELPIWQWTYSYKKHMLCKEFVKSIDTSQCNNHNIHIIITIHENYKHLLRDWAEDYDKGLDELHLVKKFKNHLNFINETSNGVNSYSDYIDIINVWFAKRKELYINQYMLKTTQYNLQITLLREKLRFIGLGLNLYDMPKTQQFEILKKHDFARLNVSVINSTASYTHTKMLELAHPDNDKLAYNYLISMRVSDLSKNAANKIQKSLDEYQKLLDDFVNADKYSDFKGKAIWLNSLDSLYKVIQDGRQRAWADKDMMQYTY